MDKKNKLEIRIFGKQGLYLNTATLLGNTSLQRLQVQIQQNRIVEYCTIVTKQGERFRICKDDILSLPN